MTSSNQEEADRLHAEAQDVMWEDEEAALVKFKRVTELAPGLATAWYNMGLIHKYRSAWEESFECNRIANQLDSNDEAAKWNLGIAATALNRWGVARETWAACGIEIPAGDGPIFEDFGRSPVRLNPDDQGEVVWGRRLCPVRLRIFNIPFRESNFHYGDIVLHDGAGTGEREWEGHVYPVFNVLELNERSPFQTHVFSARGATDEQIEQLTEQFAKIGAVEDWSKNTRVLCRQCSEGTVHEQCDTELGEEDVDSRKIAVAVQSNEELKPLYQWADKNFVEIEAI